MDHYQPYRDKFDKIDINNAADLKAWFEEFKHLSNYDHALIMGKSTYVVRKLKYKVGIKGKTPKVLKKPSIIKLCDESILVPDDWRNKEWLTENISKFGVSAVSRAVNLSRFRIYELAAKFKVPLIGGQKSKNPCCTYSWCYRHYVELGYSAKKCSSLANITRPKFVEWLVKFKIPVIDSRQLKRYEVFSNIQAREAFARLSKHPRVRHICYRSPHYVKIVFGNGRSHKIYYGDKADDYWVLRNILEPYYEYDQDIITGEGYNAHIALPESKYKSATKLEKTIALNLFCDKLMTQGWVWPSYPIAILKEDLLKVSMIKEESHLSMGDFTPVTSIFHGRKILINYFDMSEYYARLLRNKKRTFAVLKMMQKQKVTKFNTTNFIYHSRKIPRRPGIKLPPATFYKYFLRKFKVKNILDINVGCGAHALGCALEGIKYYHLNDRRFNKAIELGFAEFVNLKHEIYNDETVDLVFNDFDHDLKKYVNNLDVVLSFASKARRIVSFVPQQYKTEFKRAYNPSSIIKISGNFRSSYNYYFVW